jgi:hypothetical protein
MVALIRSSFLERQRYSHRHPLLTLMPVILRRATLRPLWSCKDHTDTLIQSRLGEKHNCGLAILWQAHFMFLPVRFYVQEADIAWTRNGHLVYTTSDSHTSKTRNRFQWRQRHQSPRDTGRERNGQCKKLSCTFVPF